MFRNSRGERDFLLTSSALALGVVLARALLGGLTLRGLTIPPFDTGLVAALLTPTFVAYTVKRVAIAGQEAAVAP
jgi:hypothetical protein